MRNFRRHLQTTNRFQWRVTRNATYWRKNNRVDNVFLVSGNPAVIGWLYPLDRWLCVSAFRQICLFRHPVWQIIRLSCKFMPGSFITSSPSDCRALMNLWNGSHFNLTYQTRLQTSGCYIHVPIWQNLFCSDCRMWRAGRYFTPKINQVICWEPQTNVLLNASLYVYENKPLD